MRKQLTPTILKTLYKALVLLEEDVESNACWKSPEEANRDRTNLDKAWDWWDYKSKISPDIP